MLLVVHFLVPLSLVGAGKPPPTELAGKRLLPRVCADVSCEVIRSREAAKTDVALKRFLARVYSKVSSELV